MSEDQKLFTPTTEVVKDAACFPRTRLGEPRGIDPDAFERWLSAIRAAPEIHIDNIDGKRADEWLATHDAEVRRAALEEAVAPEEWGVRITAGGISWVECMRNREECERFIADQPLWYTHRNGESFSIVMRSAASLWVEVR